MDQRSRVLADIAAWLAAYHADRIIRIAIDGVDGAGKTMFADELGLAIGRLGRPVIRASVDGFHNPRAVRYAKGKQSPDGFFEDSYNYARLKQELLDPLGPGGSRRYAAAAFDHVTDLDVPRVEREAAPSSILLLDGIFLHRPELRACWDASIFLRVDFAVSVARGAGRDGTSPDPAAEGNRRYVEGQRIYLARCTPEDFATIVVDNNTLEAPVIARGPEGAQRAS